MVRAGIVGGETHIGEELHRDARTYPLPGR